MRRWKHQVGWSLLRRLTYLPQTAEVSNFHTTTQTSIVRSSKEIRHNFLSYFQQHNHVFVPSSRVIPKQTDNLHFVNAGMNQFKPIFLGLADPDSEMASWRRVVNSQKCIRVGGKHNDLEEVGQDCFHHTFFEMLGSWSFGDYFKREACEYAWRLLTGGYEIPADRLCVTYFAGDENYGLESDEETRDIWRSIGVPKDRILPFGMHDNFWDMGESGPCGPCTEIHYSHLGPVDFKHLVNCGRHDVIEIWNLVFMQYNKLTDGSLQRLPKQYVDTGMGLERLTALLQGKHSNYDTDLFQPIINAIYKECKTPPYQGRVGRHDSAGIDTAYRIVADHTRMITVAIGDGLLPGRRGAEQKMKYILHRNIRFAHNVLHAPMGMLGNLVDVVVASLGDAFPDLSPKASRIKDIINTTEANYLEKWQQGHKVMRKFISKLPPGQRKIEAEQILALRDGVHGVSVPIDLILELAEDFDLIIDKEALQCQIVERKEMPVILSSQKPNLDVTLLHQLQQRNIPYTDDSLKYSYTPRFSHQYDFPVITSKVVGLVKDGKLVDSVENGDNCGILLDRTCFYAEQGGQTADIGQLRQQGSTSVEVTDVQQFQQYVLHTGHVKQSRMELGMSVELHLNPIHRVGCMRNHTATHLLNSALRRVLGESVRQKGSYVGSDKLTFDFSSSSNSINDEQFSEIEKMVGKMIEDKYPIHRGNIPFTQAKQLKDIVYLQDEAYPKNVWILSVGAPVADLLTCEDVASCSVELCGGTHVTNCGDIEAFAITGLSSVSLGTKRVTAVTGNEAKQAIQRGLVLRQEANQLMDDVRSNRKSDSWDAREKAIYVALGSNTLLPKQYRDSVFNDIARLGDRMAAHRNKIVRDKLEQRLENLLQNQPGPVVAELPIPGVHQFLKVVKKLKPRHPFMIFSSEKQNVTGICHVPKEWTERGLSVEEWTDHVQSSFNNVKGLSKDEQTYVLKGKSSEDLNDMMDVAKNYAEQYSR